MAFASGGKGVRSDINVTPLIDVVLVLLIVFMVLVPKLLMMTKVDVPPKVPPDQNNPTPPSSDQLVVGISGDDHITINDQAIAEDLFAEKIRTLMQGRSDSRRLMFFNPEDDANYGFVNKVMDIARGAGVKTIAIMTK